MLLHGTQGPEPALPHSGQRNQQLWPRISSKVPLPAPPHELGARVHRYGCAGARSMVCGGAPGGEAVSPPDSFSSSFHDTPMAPGAPRMRQPENTGCCPPSPGMHTISGRFQARPDFLTVLCRWVFLPHLEGNSFWATAGAVVLSFPLLGTQGPAKSRLVGWDPPAAG